MIQNKDQFKHYLRKIGSGEHTSQGLTREESAEALHLMLEAKATPAQIGAFMIAHRIRRPEPQELAGMIDTYKQLGPQITSDKNKQRPICFGMPFDGRVKTSPIYPLTILVLLSEGQPVVLHDGSRMPVKYGITSSELFRALGLELTGLPIQKVQTCFHKHGLALIHQPDHFPLANTLINYREEIGKRPPLASMELIWTAHTGKHLLISGFVHPPTEERAWQALSLLGEKQFISIKGLEGGTDLPISKACITGSFHQSHTKRIILHPHEHKCSGKDLQWSNLKQWKKHALEALDNHGPLKQALHWNAGVYLWFSGIVENLEEGLIKAETSIASGSAKKTMKQLITWRSNQKT